MLMNRQKRERNVIKDRVYLALFPLVAFWGYLFSQWVYAAYVHGDLAMYDAFWYGTFQVIDADLPELQRRMLGAFEPVYWLSVRIASEFFYRETFFTIVNIILVVQLLALLRRVEYPLWLIPLVFTNYHLFILLGPAERLKLATVFLLAALLAKGRWQYVFLVITPFAHLQHVVSVSLLIASRYMDTLRNFFRGRSSLIQVIALAAFAMLFAAIFVGNLGAGVGAKYESYTEDPAGNPFLSLFLAVAAALTLRNRLLALVILLPLTMLAFVLGGARMNMMTVIAVLLLFGAERRHAHPLPVLLLLYFTYKGAGFYSEVSRYGTAF